MVAVSPDTRPDYARHTTSLLKPGAFQLVVTLEYDQAIVSGPPFSVPADELLGYWSGLQRVDERDDFETCPPKFRAAGLREILEVYWRTA